jgi:hypothetical protein
MIIIKKCNLCTRIKVLPMFPVRTGVERLFERIGSGQRLHSKHKRREPDFKNMFLSV